MSNIVRFRPFKLPTITPNQFVKANEESSEKFMVSDLERSGLVPDDIFAFTQPLLPAGTRAAYTIPYFYPDGNFIVNKNNEPLMTRTKVDYLVPLNGQPKYYAQPNEVLIAHGVIQNPPYLLRGYDDGDVVAICEGEKKTAAVYKHLGIAAIGIGGCWSWQFGKDVHPWILDAVKGRKVVIIPDGDYTQKLISKAYSGLFYALKDHGIECSLIATPDKIDDWIVAGGTRAKFDELPHVDLTTMIESSESLIRRYNLSYKEDKRGKHLIQNEENMMTLFREHPGIPELWYNSDRAQMMYNNREFKEDVDDMGILCYFQRNLGFDKITLSRTRSCLSAIGKENGRSPFLERIKSEPWDGIPRLDTWLHRLWGTPDDDWHRRVGSSFFLSSIARQLNPGCKVDWMLIVIGPQGTGKSSMPQIVFDGLQSVIIGQQSDQNLSMLIHRGLVNVWDELDSFNKKDVEHLKAKVSAPTDDFRRPYSRNVELEPRRSIMYGCGNTHNFLQEDPSGYRRYVVINIDCILDFKGLEEERWQLWAEAYDRYQSEAIDVSQIEGATQVAQEYVADDPLGDQVESFLNEFERLAPGQAFGMLQVFQGIGREHDMLNVSMKRIITNRLIQLGYERGVFKRGDGKNPQKNSWRKSKE